MSRGARGNLGVRLPDADAKPVGDAAQVSIGFGDRAVFVAGKARWGGIGEPVGPAASCSVLAAVGDPERQGAVVEVQPLGPAGHGGGDATILAPQCGDGERSDIQCGEDRFQRRFDGGEAVGVLDVDPPALGGQGDAVEQSLDPSARRKMPHTHVLALGPLRPTRSVNSARESPMAAASSASGWRCPRRRLV